MRNIILFAAGTYMLPLALWSTAGATPIFNVSFGTDASATGSAPAVATAADAPPANLKPTATSAQSGTSVLVQNGATAADFSSFGSGNFLVYTNNVASGSATAKTEYELNAADQTNTGVFTLTYHLQLDANAPDTTRGRTGTFGAYFYSNSSIVGLLTVSASDGSLTLYRTTDAGTTNAAVNNFTIATGVDYTITGILTLNGNSSTVDFMVGDTKLLNGMGNGVANVPLTKIRLANLGTKANDIVGIDTVTLDISSVPEPASLSLLALGGLGLLMRRRR
jgi:hypothetical protein